MKVTVTQTIQSGSNEPVQVLWIKEGSPLSAAASLVSILNDATERATNSDIPEDIRYRTLSIRVDLTETEGQ